MEEGALGNSTEVFGSEPNSCEAFSYCPAINRSKFRFYEPQSKASCAYLCARGPGRVRKDVLPRMSLWQFES
jgi:hypothetical protein